MNSPTTESVELTDSIVENRLPRRTAQPASRADAFPSPQERIKTTAQFTVDDIELLVEAINKHDVIRGTPWDDFRLAHCVLPSWFDFGLDPVSAEYAAQQHRLWSMFTSLGRSYSPVIDEKEAPLANVDAVRRPGYYIRRDSDSVEHASHHVIATGMVVKHCGLKPGDSALEYGAGFGQIALTLARLGVVVDTVDISSVFCDYVKQQAEFFQVPLTAFEGQFGWNPRGTHQYDLILFYEAFHHCADFQSVVHEIKSSLAPRGQVLLAGEPIPRAENIYVPYPWGLRLDAESIVQMRRFGWFELGFTEDFLIRLFTNAGFSAQRMECPSSVYGEGYTFKHRPKTIDLSKEWLSQDVDFSWNNSEPNGRWTKSESRLYLDVTDSFHMLVADVTNHHPFVQSVEVTYGSDTYITEFCPGERKEIAVKADRKAPQILFRARTHVPDQSSDPRPLGIFVHFISYR